MELNNMENNTQNNTEKETEAEKGLGISDEEARAARRERVFGFLRAHDIDYEVYYHPEAPTIEIARRYWRRDGSKHCKNLFFRNHKGNRHYLVVFDCERELAIHDLEHRLHQGKLSFASEQRMDRYLGLRPGSVSPFGLINDAENHVHLFLDRTLRDYPSLSFHPNDNTATVVISQQMFGRYLEAVGNTYEYISLYDETQTDPAAEDLEGACPRGVSGAGICAGKISVQVVMMEKSPLPG